jgi:hypothetical protein
MYKYIHRVLVIVRLRNIPVYQVYTLLNITSIPRMTIGYRCAVTPKQWSGGEDYGFRKTNGVDRCVCNWKVIIIDTYIYIYIFIFCVRLSFLLRVRPSSRRPIGVS